MKNIFLKKSFKKCCGKTISRNFFKKIKIEDILGSVLSLIYFAYIVRQVGRLSKYIETKLQTSYFSSFKTFYKNKRGLEPVSPPHFLYDF